MLLGILVNYIPDLPEEDYKLSIGNVYIPYVPGHIPSGLPSNTKVEPYDIMGIEGLNAPESTAAFSSPGQDGGVHLTSEVDQREITIYLGFNSFLQREGSVTAGRTLLYSIFPTNGQVSLTIYTSHMPPVEINGFVEKHDSNIFTNEPLSQIVLICKDPRLYAVEPSVNEYPLNTNQNGQTLLVDYKGTWDSGFSLDLNFKNNFNPAHVEYLTTGLGIGGPPEPNPSPQIYRNRFFRAYMVGPFDNLPRRRLSIRYDTRQQNKGFYYFEPDSDGSVHTMSEYIRNFSNAGLLVPPYWVQLNSMVRRIRMWVGWPDGTAPSTVNADLTLTYREAYVGI